MFFIWWFFLLPHDLPVCTLWVSQAPTQAQMVQACGTWPPPDIDEMVWRALDPKSGLYSCERPANELPKISCVLGALDHYQIAIVRPNFSPVAGGCIIKLDHDGIPTYDEAHAQCPGEANKWNAGQLLLKSVGSLPSPSPQAAVCSMPALTIGPGLLELPAKPSDLATSKPYQLLAGALLWNGYARPNCDGYSGLNSLQPLSVTACGMISALPHVIEWQNRFDEQIYRAGQANGVPPKLLKGMIAVESQFWPGFVNLAGETGLLQITGTGADVALRYSPELYKRFCTGSICANGYDFLDPFDQWALRHVLLQKAATDVNLDARIVASYYCYANEINPQASPEARWDVTLAAWNAGTNCIQSGELCPEGQKYIDEVTK